MPSNRSNGCRSGTARFMARGSARCARSCKGIGTSQKRVLRLMRGTTACSPNPVGDRLQVPARSRRNHHPRRSVDEMWGTDMTATILTTGEHLLVFVAIDHLSSRCVRLHAAKRGTRIKALQPIRQGVPMRFETIDEGAGIGLDHPPRQRAASQSAASSKRRFVGWGSTRPRPSFDRPKARAAPSASIIRSG